MNDPNPWLVWLENWRTWTILLLLVLLGGVWNSTENNYRDSLKKATHYRAIADAQAATLQGISLNCSDVETQDIEMQYFPADPQGFDGDRDGIGCEARSSYSLEEPNYDEDYYERNHRRGGGF